MTVLSTIRRRFRPSVSASSPESDDGDPVAGGSALPVAGYDRLDVPEVTRTLRDHSQIELEAIEDYERAHQDRDAVLHKLRWMRGREPLPGYDTLGVDEISTALANADLATIKRVRGYERKFANRPEVLDEAARVLHLRHATRPTSPAPAYQPLSASIAPNGRRAQHKSRP